MLVLDAADRPGGRMKTDEVDGFLLDRGFQVTFTAYPHQRREIDYASLDLRRFEPGARVWHGERWHFLHRDAPIETLFCRLFGLGDKLRVLSWTREVSKMSIDEIRRLDDDATEVHLRRYGFSEAFIDRFARPFLGGIFLDPSLAFSRRQFAFVWKMLAEGDTVVPASGIEAIPRQVAADLPPDALRMQARVRELVREGERVAGVRLDCGETIDAASVVIATDAPEAARLAGVPVPVGAKSSVCLYFETPEPVVFGNYLLLNGTGKGLINEIVPSSNLSDRVAPEGRHLCSCTILGDSRRSDSDLLTWVRHELRAWMPGSDAWRLVHIVRVPYAQMLQSPGFGDQLPHVVTGTPGLFVAGEFTTNSSIDGAIESGLACARALLGEGARAEAEVAAV